MLTEIIHNTKN